MVLKYFPKLQQNDFSDAEGKDEFRVLLLGGSVLHKNHGTIAEDLLIEFQELAKAKSKTLRLINLAYMGHTTMDSRMKLQLLQDFRLDLVVVYHGINETRANNIPSELFHNDYRHYATYQRVHAILDHPEMNYFVLPYLVRRLANGLWHQWFPHDYISRDYPREEYLKFGAEIKTKEPFRSNLTAIIKDCNDREIPAVIGTFAFHFPADYSKEKILSGEYDGYNMPATRKQFPVEIWGVAENVVKGLEVHNEVIREVAAKEECVFVDYEKQIPDLPENYDDICHLSDRGCHLFVKALMNEIND